MYGYTDAISRFIERRRKPIVLLRGFLQFAIWSLTEPFRALALAFHKTPALKPAGNGAAATVRVRGAPASGASGLRVGASQPQFLSQASDEQPS